QQIVDDKTHFSIQDMTTLNYFFTTPYMLTNILDNTIKSMLSLVQNLDTTKQTKALEINISAVQPWTGAALATIASQYIETLCPIQD
ncbi:hypothetical protein ACJX0J_035669, partial [Zea mays]